MVSERAAAEVTHLKEDTECFRFGKSRLNKPTTSVIPFIPTFTEKMTKQLTKILEKKEIIFTLATEWALLICISSFSHSAGDRGHRPLSGSSFLFMVLTMIIFKDYINPSFYSNTIFKEWSKNRNFEVFYSPSWPHIQSFLKRIPFTYLKKKKNK